MQMTGFTVHWRDKGRPLVDFLSKSLNCSKKKAKQLLDERVVFVNGKRVWMAKHTLRPGDRVETIETKPSTRKRTSGILYEDSGILIVDKPAGALSNGPRSVEADLQRSRKEPGLRAAHRLDKGTSGCLILARSDKMFDKLVDVFRNDRVTKIYQAIVYGAVPRDLGHIDLPIEGKTARTRLMVLSGNRTATHLKLNILTGRTHQIRRHLASLGHPVLGDRRYETRQIDAPEFRSIPRQMLHATSIAFPLPGRPGVIRARAPLPSDFKSCLDMLALK